MTEKFVLKEKIIRKVKKFGAIDGILFLLEIANNINEESYPEGHIFTDNQIKIMNILQKTENTIKNIKNNP